VQRLKKVVARSFQSLAVPRCEQRLAAAIEEERGGREISVWIRFRWGKEEFDFYMEVPILW
jgi:hypothetical protein